MTIRARDVGLAFAVFGLEVLLLAGGGVGDEGAERRSFDGLALLLAAGASLPLVARRDVPLGAFGMTALASSFLNLLDYPSGPPVGATVALYFLSTQQAGRAPARPAGAVVLGLFAFHIGAEGWATGEFPGAELLLGATLWAGAWVAGDRTRLRRERMAELEERARRAERDAERERRLAAAEERTRIARDLHDSAGHAISVVLVHAGAARLLQERDPAAARAALETIEDVARETLGEIDQLVRALREGPEAEIEPPLGLAGLEGLVERQRTAGLPVELRVRGEWRSLPPAVDQSAYRILQEALTNAVRHGAGAASVEVAFQPEAVELVVTNPAADGAEAGDRGLGLVGMRERAALVGGRLEAGVTNGSFHVRAVLPYAAVRP